MLIELNIKENQLYNIDFHPIYHNSISDKNKIGINLMPNEDKDIFLKNIKKISKKYKNDPNYVYQSWQKLSLKNKNLFFSSFNGNGRILRKINQYFPYLNFKYNRKSKTILKNTISCETHLEMARTILEYDIDN